MFFDKNIVMLKWSRVAPALKSDLNARLIHRCTLYARMQYVAVGKLNWRIFFFCSAINSTFGVLHFPAGVIEKQTPFIKVKINLKV